MSYGEPVTVPVLDAGGNRINLTLEQAIEYGVAGHLVVRTEEVPPYLEPAYWPDDPRDLYACAWNAVVNQGSGRFAKKMWALTDSLNRFERAKGRRRLEFLVARGIIDGFTPCPAECRVAPAGLFHAPGCENESNTDVTRSRNAAAQAAGLPAQASDVSLVGDGGRGPQTPDEKGLRLA